MKLLLDSANLDDIKRIANTDAISGVTTNPSLMAKEEKGDYHTKLLEIGNVLNLSMVMKHLSVEVITLNQTEMIEQALELKSKFRHLKSIDLHIKIPVTLDNLQVITSLERHGVKVNATACMTHSQARMALDAGASIISYFYNRMKDGGDLHPATQLRRTTQYIADNTNKIICGSIRNPEDIFKCWDAGSYYVTASLKIIEQMLSHPQTDIAIKGFQKDIEAWLK